jgi:hypothetical protein
MAPHAVIVMPANLGLKDLKKRDLLIP